SVPRASRYPKGYRASQWLNYNIKMNNMVILAFADIDHIRGSKR
ncbi:unnamed protein product, partial [Didymodactylos carnosus]